MDFSFDNDDVNDDVNEIGIELATSQNEDDIEMVINTDENTQKKRNKFQWSIDSEWDDLDKAIDHIENEGFINYDHSDLKCGLKFYFRCKLVPKKHKQWCSKRYTLFLPSNSTKIKILRNEHDHDHDKVLEGTVRPPSQEIIEYITDLFKCGVKSVGDILQRIDFVREKNGLFKSEKNPKKRQIEYMLKKFKNSETPVVIKLGDMIEWSNANDIFPSDIDNAFVIGSEFSDYDQNLNFRIALSTPLLLNKLSKLKKNMH